MLGRGFRIGRLFGINIRVDWSWLLIAMVITWNLTNVFGQLHPEWSTGMRWGLAAVAALLFFASVLAHELAHALVARAQKLPVQNITLFLFGGVANIQREPESPKNEFTMAAAGPLMSLVLGIVMLLIAVGSVLAEGGSFAGYRIVGSISPASTLLFWLGSINLILAAFNLIPGYPLDGGRVLRSFLWAATRDMEKATRWAAQIGQFIAWMMIAAGAAMSLGLRIPLLGTGMVNGIWLAFIGWFLNNASTQSLQQVKIQGILEGVPVSRLMKLDPATVDSDITIAELIYAHRIGSDEPAFPVIEDGRLVGLITLDEAQRIPRERWGKIPVREIMTPKPRLVTIAPDADASSALEMLVQREVHQLPVIQENNAGHTELLGLLRRKDILRWLQIHDGRNGRRRELQ